MATPRKLIKEKPGPKGKLHKIDPLVVARMMAELGATEDKIAKALGYSKSGLRLLKQKNPAIVTAIKGSKDAADKAVEKALYQKATGYSCPAVKFVVVAGKVKTIHYVEHYPPSDTACIFWLKNRQPAEWREKNEVGFVNPDGTGISPITVCVTPEEMPRAKAAEPSSEPAATSNQK